MQRRHLFLHIIFLAAGFLLGITAVKFGSPRFAGEAGRKFFGAEANNRGIIIREGGYKFINPILACEIAQGESFNELNPIENKLGTLIESKKESGEAENISLYFRLLNSGRWFGINEDEKYAPASLEKVLIIMAYLKASETDHFLLDREIPPASLSELKSQNSDENLDRSQSYTIQELIEKMAVYSSNPALFTLVDNMDKNTSKALKNVYADLNTPFPESMNLEDLSIMSPQVYSLAMRILYGSTYLNRENSEKTLELLSRTSFKDGLFAGLPEKTLLAHKFGVRKVFDKGNLNSQKWELHDCGIIYYPNHPYLLCVMTRGDNLIELAKTIADISRETYNKISVFFSSQN